LEFGVIRVATVAPEEPGSLEAIAQLSAAGVRVSLGHTVATAEQALAGIAAGARGGTHLFNAMSPYEGRNPGVVGALLASRDTYAELILDGHHVHFTSFRAAHAAKGGRLLLVTDCMRAGGLPDGTSELGGAAVMLSGGTVRLPDGTLAGSVLTLDQAVRNAVTAGLSLEEAVRAASTVPAEYLGLEDRGRLQGGAMADVVVLDRDLVVREVYVEGRRAA
jgi:N-acetylglucosamine-6-phosphate deacetylase